MYIYSYLYRYGWIRKNAQFHILNQFTFNRLYFKAWYSYSNIRTRILLPSLAPSSQWVWVYSCRILNIKRAPEMSAIFVFQLLDVWWRLVKLSSQIEYYFSSTAKREPFEYLLWPAWAVQLVYFSQYFHDKFWNKFDFYNHCNPNILDTSGALFISRIQT